MKTERTPLCEHTDTQGHGVLTDTETVTDTETGGTHEQANTGHGLLVTDSRAKAGNGFLPSISSWYQLTLLFGIQSCERIISFVGTLTEVHGHCTPKK